MRPKTLLILLLLVAGLGAFIWFFERDLPGSDERAQQAKRVLAIEPDEVIEVVIERGDGRVRLVRPLAPEEPGEAEPDGIGANPVKREWRLHEPFEARADTASADRLVDTLSLLEKERTLDDVDRSAVGLESPRATITVKTSDTESTLRVGSEIPASTNLVLAHDADTLVVSGTFWELLGGAGGDWRSLDLLPLHSGAVERVELASAVGAGQAGAGVVLVKRDDAAFWMAAPLVDKADKVRVDELLDAMFRLEIGGYLDEPQQTPAEMGLDPAEKTLSVSFVGREEPYTVEVGAATPDLAGERFARVGGQVMTIGGGLDEALSRTAAEWQETTWTGFEVFEVDSFRVEDQAGELLLERAGSDWTRNGEAIAYGPVSDFLYALAGAAGTEVVDRSAAASLGADLAKADLEIVLKGSEREESLRLHTVQTGALASSDGREFWLTLSEGAVEDLRVKLQAIRDQARLSEQPDAEAEG